MPVAKLARLIAAVGAFIWGVTLVVPAAADSWETLLIQKILLFGIFVIVPLGLSLVLRAGEEEQTLLSWAVRVQPAGALAALISFLFEPGPIAASLAVVWLVVTILIAFVGVARFFAGQYKLPELSIIAGLAYLPVGGVWFVLSRLGVQALGFGDTIVLLTAVHFHFAGFAAPLIVGVTGRALAQVSYPRSVYAFSVGGAVLSMPLVAAGITFSPSLALGGAAIISVAVVLLAFLVVVYVLRLVRSVFSRVLLGVSSVASCTSMVFACLYAYSIVSKTLIFDIPTMAKTHGVMNAFGFTLCALIAWSLETR